LYNYFQRRDTFREHLLIHTGPRYRCTHCPKEFVQRSNLRRHIRIHLVRHREKLGRFR
jgi:uncharacterized Zn-finger protein